MSLSGVNGSPISISNEAIARAAQFPTVQSKIEFIRFYNYIAHTNIVIKNGFTSEYTCFSNWITFKRTLSWLQCVCRKIVRQFPPWQT